MRCRASKANGPQTLATKLGEAGADLVDVLKGRERRTKRKRRQGEGAQHHHVGREHQSRRQALGEVSGADREPRTWWMKAATGVASYIASVANAMMKPAQNVNPPRWTSGRGRRARRRVARRHDGQRQKSGPGTELGGDGADRMGGYRERLNTLISSTTSSSTKAGALTEGLRSPQEEGMAAHLEKINELQRAGAIDARTAARGEADAAQIMQDVYTDAASAIVARSQPCSRSRRGRRHRECAGQQKGGDEGARIQAWAIR